MQAEGEAGLAKDVYETREYFVVKARECDALKANFGRIKKGLATLSNASTYNEEKIRKL